MNFNRKIIRILSLKSVDLLNFVEPLSIARRLRSRKHNPSRRPHFVDDDAGFSFTYIYFYIYIYTFYIFLLLSIYLYIHLFIHFIYLYLYISRVIFHRCVMCHIIGGARRYERVLKVGRRKADGRISPDSYQIP